jgi:hypothetical protein
LVFPRNRGKTTENTEDTETEGEEEGLRILDLEPFFLSGLCVLCVLCGETSGISRLSNRSVLWSSLFVFLE